ncbi:hypothetical protein JCM8547_004834 [Rhodosporidiobolus lusitaniae]
MLKAKAKAAATAAAAKRKAAAAAAAAQEAAAQQAAAAAAGVGVPSTTRSGRGLRPNLTQPWADGAASLLAPGGSIQRIGYDQNVFDEAVRVVIFGQDPSPEASTSMSTVGMIEVPGQKKLENGGEGKEGEGEGKEEEGKEQQGGGGYKTNKEDLAVILSALDVPSALASQTLRSHKGNLQAALRELSAPAPVAASA